VLTASIIRAIPALMIVAAIALMMEAVSTSETSANFYQITRPIPEDSHLRIRRRESPKSHRDIKLFVNFPMKDANVILGSVIRYHYATSEPVCPTFSPKCRFLSLASLQKCHLPQLVFLSNQLGFNVQVGKNSCNSLFMFIY
jgi:hypothetical protein